MIKDPLLIGLLLLAVECAVLYVSSRPQFKKYFSFFPAVFWIYLIPMIFSTLGLIDPKASIYQMITEWFLPASLVLLLLSSDIKAILRLGKPALLMMLAGSLGIMIGMPLVFALVKPWVGSEMWSGFGALSGSWVGGSANMIAVKEAIGTPENIFAPMVVVDTVVPYVWMGFLVAASGFQWQFDRINQSDRQILETLNIRTAGFAKNVQKRFSLKMFGLIILVAAAGAVTAKNVAGHLPVIQDVLSGYAWTIIVSSLLGIGLSFTSARSLEQHGASRAGYFLLYFVLTMIGAKANIAHIGPALILIAVGFVVVVFHAAAVLLAARLLRAPMFLAAVASQANIGGVASAPIVAEVYQPGLASVGLLLAIFGNIVGTYSGILTAQFCRWIAGI